MCRENAHKSPRPRDGWSIAHFGGINTLCSASLIYRDKSTIKKTWKMQDVQSSDVTFFRQIQKTLGLYCMWQCILCVAYAVKSCLHLSLEGRASTEREDTWPTVGSLLCLNIKSKWKKLPISYGNGAWGFTMEYGESNTVAREHLPKPWKSEVNAYFHIPQTFAMSEHRIPFYFFFPTKGSWIVKFNLWGQLRIKDKESVPFMWVGLPESNALLLWHHWRICNNVTAVSGNPAEKRSV